MYFTDRLSAPTSSFIPPPVTDSEGAGYLPDCKYLLRVCGRCGATLIYSAPIMAPSRRPRDFSRKWCLGHDPSYTPYTNRGSTGPLEIPNHHHPPFYLFKSPTTSRTLPPPHLFTRCAIIRYPLNRSTKPNHRIGITSRKSSPYASRLEPNGGDQD